MSHAFRIGDPCVLCDAPILRGQAYSSYTEFLPSWSSLAFMSGKAAHHACLDAWPLLDAFDAIMECFEQSQKDAQRHGMHTGYDFERDCDRLDPLWPNARTESLEARWEEHLARSEAEWAEKYADAPSGRIPTLPSPPPDPNEPVLERLHPDAAEAELGCLYEHPPPLGLMRCP